MISSISGRVLGQRDLDVNDEIAGFSHVTIGDPLAPSRSFVPLEVFGGTFTVRSPVGVGTFTFAPLQASTRVTGTRTWRLSSSTQNDGWGRT